MKNCSKLLALLLCLAMMLGIMAGCGGDAASSVSSAPAEENSAVAEAPAVETPAAEEEEASVVSPVDEAPITENVEMETIELPLVEEAVHYTCWIPVAPYVSNFMNLEEFSEKTAVVKLINEATNVYIDFNAIAGGQVEEESFNLMIAGRDYMDILGVMNYYSTGHEGAIEDEVIIDLKDDLQEYCPNYWNLLTSNDTAYMTQLTESGYMGCIAQLLKKAGTENQGMVIRKDWLEESGVTSTETVDDFEKYLQYALDTYGAYAYMNYSGLEANLAAMFNTTGGMEVHDGKVVHTYDSDEFRNYLTKMNDWYKKGIIDVEFYNDTDVTTVRQDMANDLCSYVEGSATNMSHVYDMNQDNTKMQLMGIDYPKAEGVDEIKVAKATTIIKNSDTWSISTACGDHTDLLKLVNWLYSEEGQLLYNWGEEGVAFDYDENGDPQWTDLVVNNADGLNFMFASYLYATGTGSVFFPGVYDMEKEFYSYDDEQLAAVDTFASMGDSDEWSMPSYVSLTIDEQIEYNTYATDLETYTEGMILKFVMGDEPMENYDAFIEQCYAMGLQEMLDLYQGAYDRAQEALNAA